MIRYFLFAYLCVAALIVIGFGFRGHKFKDSPFELFNDMDRQPKVSHQVSSDFFADGVATRRPVEGTVPMGFDVPAVAAADGQEPAKFAFTIADDYYNTATTITNNNNNNNGFATALDISPSPPQPPVSNYATNTTPSPTPIAVATTTTATTATTSVAIEQLNAEQLQTDEQKKKE